MNNSQPSPQAIRQAGKVYLTALDRIERTKAEIAARGLRPWDLPTNWWDKVAVTSMCWLWTGAKNSKGYASVTNGKGRSALAHRMVYEMFVAPIPEGLTIDHLCRIHRCINPEHLEPVT